METGELAQALIGRARDRKRYLVAIAGPPGSGKSTLAKKLCDAINKESEGDPAIAVPMDGYHLDNRILESRNLLNRKGASETFDADGFVAMIERLRFAARPVVIPLFDRERDLAVAGAEVVLPEHRIVVVEGNYLLLDEEPWSRLDDIFDYSIFIDPGLPVLRDRLIQRWRDHGYDEEGARERAMSNDVPNAKRVLADSRSADLTIE